MNTNDNLSTNMSTHIYESNEDTKRIVRYYSCLIQKSLAWISIIAIVKLVPTGLVLLASLTRSNWPALIISILLLVSDFYLITAAVKIQSLSRKPNPAKVNQTLRSIGRFFMIQAITSLIIVITFIIINDYNTYQGSMYYNDIHYSDFSSLY